MDNTVLIHMNRLQTAELKQVHSGLADAFIRTEARMTVNAVRRDEARLDFSGESLSNRVDALERQNNVIAGDLRQIERSLDTVSDELVRRALDESEA